MTIAKYIAVGTVAFLWSLAIAYGLVGKEKHD
jgi:hypothetical protein